MKMLGSRILCQRKVIATRRMGWLDAFALNAEYELSIAPIPDDELIPMLCKRQILEPLRMLPLRWEGAGFQVAHADPWGRTETFYAFSRQVHYTGSTILWKQAPYRAYTAPITARFNKDDQLFLEGYCTGPERSVIDEVLRADLQLVKHAVEALTPMVETYNAALEIAAGNWVHRNRGKIAEWRTACRAL